MGIVSSWFSHLRVPSCEESVPKSELPKPMYSKLPVMERLDSLDVSYRVTMMNQPHTQELIIDAGDVSLSGTLFMPQVAKPHPVLVVMHSSAGDLRTDPTYIHLKEHLPSNGIAVFIFDRRGSGKSTGDFNTASFDDLSEDGLAAIRTLKELETIDETRIGVWGLSQGAWIAPLIATKAHTEVALVVAVSSVAVSPAEQMIYSASVALQQENYSESVISRVIDIRRSVDQYYRDQHNKSEIIELIKACEDEPWFPLTYLDKACELPDDVRQDKWYFEMDYDPVPALQNVQVPIIFFYAEKDPWVPIQQSINIVREHTLQNIDVTIARIKGANHFMDRLDANEDNQRQDSISILYIRQMIKWLEIHFRK